MDSTSVPPNKTTFPKIPLETIPTYTRKMSSTPLKSLHNLPHPPKKDPCFYEIPEFSIFATSWPKKAPQKKERAFKFLVPAWLPQNRQIAIASPNGFTSAPQVEMHEKNSCCTFKNPSFLFHQTAWSFHKVIFFCGTKKGHRTSPPTDLRSIQKAFPVHCRKKMEENHQGKQHQLIPSRTPPKMSQTPNGSVLFLRVGRSIFPQINSPQRTQILIHQKEAFLSFFSRDIPLRR